MSTNKFKTNFYFVVNLLKQILHAVVANKLVTQLLPVASSDGILYQMSAEDIPYKKIVSIVIDLILAAGDTVSSKLTIYYKNIYLTDTAVIDWSANHDP